MKCHLCESLAVGIFDLPGGCVCSPDTTQALCAQHALKSTALGGIFLLRDLTAEYAFSRYWVGEQRSAKSTSECGITDQLAIPGIEHELGVRPHLLRDDGAIGARIALL